MTQQIVALHGGTVFRTDTEYLEYLQTRPLSLDSFRSKDWKSNLQSTLGSGFDVLLPQMPHNRNARYRDWKIWFERIISLLDNEVILIGHSLGGIFLAQYLSENDYPKKVKATMLVSAPFLVSPDDRLVDFMLPSSLDKFSAQGGRIFVYHSEDDQVVPFACAAKYKKALPGAEYEPFVDRQHFNQEEFAEIITDIKSVT